VGWNLIQPDSMSPSKLYFLALTGVFVGVAAALLAVQVGPRDFPYYVVGIALLSLAATMFAVWFLRLWLVGRVDRNIEGRITAGVLRSAAMLAITTVGVMFATFLLIAYLFLALSLHWDLTRWGQAIVSVVAAHIALRMILGLILNLGLIAQRRSSGPAPIDI
jgi:hypothetical protein